MLHTQLESFAAHTVAIDASLPAAHTAVTISRTNLRHCHFCAAHTQLKSSAAHTFAIACCISHIHLKSFAASTVGMIAHLQSVPSCKGKCLITAAPASCASHTIAYAHTCVLAAHTAGVICSGRGAECVLHAAHSWSHAAHTHTAALVNIGQTLKHTLSPL